MTRTTTTHAELSAIADFDHPFTVSDNGTLSDAHDVYAPEVHHSDVHDISIDSAGYAEWEALTGYTGQYSYNGAVMHASEFLGGRLADDILATPGTYVVTVVSVHCVCEPHDTHMSWFGTALYCETEQNAYCNFECTCDSDEPAGWAILRLSDTHDAHDMKV